MESPTAMDRHFGADSSKLNDELEKYRRQFGAIEAEARDILDRLTDAQLAWQPAPSAWSVGDCLDHLVVT